MNKTKTKPAPARPPALKITSLDELQALVDAPLVCAFQLDGRELEVPLRRVTPAIEEQRREILRSVAPAPFDKTRGEYDLLHPVYVKAKAAAEQEARALLVYACCPAVAAKKPGLTNTKEIMRFVQSILLENILDVIAMTALASGVGVEVTSRANFISPPDSEN